jgi:hypothetical protein
MSTHEIRVVAWDQEKKRFGIANSWGKAWGIDGFAWLDEKFFQRILICGLSLAWLPPMCISSPRLFSKEVGVLEKAC